MGLLTEAAFTALFVDLIESRLAERRRVACCGHARRPWRPQSIRSQPCPRKADNISAPSTFFVQVWLCPRQLGSLVDIAGLFEVAACYPVGLSNPVPPVPLPPFPVDWSPSSRSRAARPRD